MTDVCMFDILELPEKDLRRVLLKASTRCLAKLATAYPRSVGNPFIEILTGSTSAATIEFLHSEISSMQVPSYPEIRQAEEELLKLIYQENLQDLLSSSRPATPIAR